LVALAFTFFAVPATSAAATTITSPASPLVVSTNASGVTIVASGFAPLLDVFVEQCDGVPVSDPRWSATLDCDLGSSPAPAIADAHGTVTFDGQRNFHPFHGESPQSLFNCVAPGEAAPRNDLPSFSDCRVRVSTNNSAATADQTFLSMRVTVGRGAASPTQSSTTMTTSPRKAPSPPRSRRPPSKKTKAAPSALAPNDGRAAAVPRARASVSSQGRPAGGGALTGYALVGIGLAIALAMRRWLPASR